MSEQTFKNFDRRVIERYKDKGIIKEKEYKDYMSSLPNEEGNAQWVEMDLHDAEISEKDEDSDRDSDEAGA